MPDFVLQPGVVQVWVADLDTPPSALAAYARLLTPDEQERAARLHFAHLRARFVSGRGILRRLLGGYLQVAPQQIVFTYGAHGKPELGAPMLQTGAPLAFNLAHTQNLAVYAFALAPRLGVDVEQMRAVLERDAIVARFFSPRERKALAALPAVERDAAFFLGWTRKEAYLKALGAGITYPLDRFSVSLTPGAPALLLEAAVEDAAAAPWTLLPFTPAPQHAAAVALEGSNWTLSLRQWASPGEAPTALL